MPESRSSNRLIWLGTAVWLTGAAVLGWYAHRYDWSPGVVILAACGWCAVAAGLARQSVRGLFGPVFHYEVVRLGRRKSTFIFRLIYILGLMALLGLRYLTWLEDQGYFRASSRDVIDSQRLSEFATEFFLIFSGVQVVVVALLTPVYVAGSIADEKERKTLEFLLATDLRGHEIVFGKMAARVLTLLMYVLAGLPIIGFLQLFGGIDPDLLLVSTAASVITILGFSAVSIFCSVNLQKPRDAIVISYILLILYLALSLAVVGYCAYLSTSTGPGTIWLGLDLKPIADGLYEGMQWVTGGNLLFHIVFILEGSFRTGLTSGILTAALVKYAAFWGATSFVLLLYAVKRLRPIALEQRDNAPRKLSKRTARLRPEVGTDAMLWKEVFIEGRGRTGCLGAFVSIAIVMLVFIAPVILIITHFGQYIPILSDLFDLRFDGLDYSQRFNDFRKAIGLWVRIATGVMSALAFLAAAVRGAGAVSGERDKDTWISLISTPLSAWEMLRGKWFGCLYSLRKMYFALLLVWAFGLFVGSVQPIMIVAAVIHLFVYISAFCWIGILCSISARNTLIASVRALLVSFMVGGGFWAVIGICCCLPLAPLLRGPDDLSVASDYLSQFLLGLTAPFVMGWLPLREFTERGTVPFSPREGVLAPFIPFVGLMIWVLFTWLLGRSALLSYQAISNRNESAKIPKREPKR